MVVNCSEKVRQLEKTQSFLSGRRFFFFPFFLVIIRKFYWKALKYLPLHVITIHKASCQVVSEWKQGGLVNHLDLLRYLYWLLWILHRDTSLDCPVWQKSFSTVLTFYLCWYLHSPIGYSGNYRSWYSLKDITVVQFKAKKVKRWHLVF